VPFSSREQLDPRARTARFDDGIKLFGLSLCARLREAIRFVRDLAEPSVRALFSRTPNSSILLALR
jgi:hypothetical protein